MIQLGLSLVAALLVAVQEQYPAQPLPSYYTSPINAQPEYLSAPQSYQQTLAPTAMSQDISPAISNPMTTALPTEMPRILVDEEIELPKFKKQAIQKIAFAGGWLGATSRNDLSSTFASAGITIGLPLGRNMDNILAVTPSFRCDWIDASSAIEIPSELFDVGLEVFHSRKINDRLKLLALVRPSHRSDFKTTENAVRVFGLGLFIWDYKPEVLSVSFGAVYLGRSDITALPAVGLTWTPNKQNRFELQFPRSRAWHRLRKNGAESELWTYVSIGIGGNTWAVTRSGGVADEVALRDIRITTGIERIVAGGGGWFVETGLALDRSLEYISTSASRVSLSNGVLLSAGWTY